MRKLAKSSKWDSTNKNGILSIMILNHTAETSDCQLDKLFRDNCTYWYARHQGLNIHELEQSTAAFPSLVSSKKDLGDAKINKEVIININNNAALDLTFIQTNKLIFSIFIIFYKNVKGCQRLFLCILF